MAYLTGVTGPGGVTAVAGVGGFSLLAVLILVADENPTAVAGAGTLDMVFVGLDDYGEGTPYNIGVHNPP